MLSGATMAAALRYAFQILTARWLGVAEYGVVSNLFAWVLTLVGFLSSGTAVAITRFVSQREAQGKDANSAIRGGLIMEGALFAGLVAVGYIFRTALADRVFEGDPFLLFVMIGAVIGQGMLVMLHGVLKGFRRFRFSAALLFVLPAIRLSLAGVLVAVLAYGATGAAISILVAPVPALILGIYWTWRAVREGGGGVSEPLSFQAFAAFALPATFVTGIERFMPRSGTMLINLLAGGNAAELVGLFTAALTLARAPELLLEALSGPLLSNFSRADALGDRALLRRYVLRTIQALAIVLVAYAIAMPIVGPRLIPIIYGKGFSFPQADLFLLSVGTGFYFSAKLVRQLVLVKRGAAYVARIWICGLVVLVATALLLPLTLLRRVETAYVLSNGLVAAILVLQAYQSAKQPG